MKIKTSKREILTKAIISTVLLMIMFLSFFFSKKLETLFGMNLKYAKNEVSSSNLLNSSYLVEYIDVGQGNCTLITFPDNKTMLIDGGNTMYGEVVANHLDNKGIESIDFLIATHSDSDHIGGLNHVLDKFEIKNIYRPFQIAGTGDNANTFVANPSEDLKDVYLHYATLSNRNKISRVTSSIYNIFIEKIYNESYTENEKSVKSRVTVFYDGLKITGENYEIEFFAPLLRDNAVSLPSMSSTYGYATKGYGVSNSNDNSAIFLITILDEKFLFTGDASSSDSKTQAIKPDKFEEIDFVLSLTTEEKIKLSTISVYLAGHHGSSYSSGTSLFEIINPKFLVISVGLGNSYGHPSSAVVFRAEKTKNLENDYLLRTDKSGTICFGEIDNKLFYSLQVSAINNTQNLTWKLFAIIICACLIILVIFFKPPKRKIKFIDIKNK